MDKRKSVGVHKGNVHMSVETQWMTPKAATEWCMEVLRQIDRANAQREVMQGNRPPEGMIRCVPCGHDWAPTARPGSTTLCPKCKHQKRVPSAFQAAEA